LRSRPASVERVASHADVPFLCGDSKYRAKAFGGEGGKRFTAAIGITQNVMTGERSRQGRSDGAAPACTAMTILAGAGPS
jgi:hypothetical protein